MNIEEFVSEALTQITKGVVTAQRQLEDTGALVNPYMRFVSEKIKLGEAEMRGGEIVGLVEFDLAVRATEGKETKGGIAIIAGPINLGSAGKSDASSGTESRVKFSVPLLLPVQRAKK